MRGRPAPAGRGAPPPVCSGAPGRGPAWPPRTRRRRPGCSGRGWGCFRRSRASRLWERWWAAPAVVAALAMDWARFRGMLPSVPPLCGELVSAAAAQAKPAAAGGAASRALAMVPPEERQQQVQQQLQGMVQELLGRDVDPEEPLMEAGLDSMSAVELHSGVQQTMGVELPATLMFDYPSLQAVSGFVSERLEVAPVDVGGGPGGADVFGEASAGVSAPVWEESWAPAPPR